MRRIFFTSTILIAFSIIARSQNLDQAKQYIYYQKWHSAENELQKAISTQPGQPQAYYYLSEFYMDRDKDAKAKVIVQKGIDLAEKNNLSKKEHPLIFVASAHLLLDQGKKDQAQQQFDELLQATKYKNADLMMAVAKAYIASPNGDPNQAIELLEKAQKRDKKNANIPLLIGNAYRKLLDGSNAFKYYTKALEMDPSLAEAHHKLGEIFKSQKNSELYVEQFTDAVKADKNYVPSLRELYDYYFYSGNFQQAKEYLNRYIANADPSVQTDYMKADLFFVTKKYSDAINTAEGIIKTEKDSAQPRLYKMIAYSWDELGDSVKALQAVNTYFDKEKEKNYVMKDYDLKARLLEKNGIPDEAITWYEKAFTAAKKPEVKDKYMRKLAGLYKEQKDYASEAVWRDSIYTMTQSPSNVDLFNWGVSLYFAGNYHQSDSVFGLYAGKYPKQLFGYLWRARCNVAIDTTMELGLAIPYYQKLIELAEADKQANQKILISAYTYLGGYEANVKKDYEKSLDWFNKVLELDENNSAALRFSETIKKWLEQSQKQKEDSTRQTEENTKPTGAEPTSSQKM